MLIVTPQTPGYDDYRQIANARFNLKPDFIYYPENPADVQKALNDAKPPTKRPVRMRSGGHQHEGMCSGNNLQVIDLSKFNKIEFAPDGNTAWIGAGAQLEDVYKLMFAKKRLIPGGGCGHVHVGGVVQGGGWGPYSRALGLTCDRILGFKIVTADGKYHDNVTANDPNYHDLFWGVCGGGGGNFGIVTEFNFNLARHSDQIWTFTVRWTNPTVVEGVIQQWMNAFPGDFDLRLTSFARLNAPSDAGDPPVLVAGFFLGEQAELELALRRLLRGYYVQNSAEYHPVNAIGKLTHPEYQPGPPNLANTCDGNPFPHKVSSCFPRAGFGEREIAYLVQFMKKSGEVHNARRYLSFHSLGGAITVGNQWSCFPYRQKPFMMQYQTWWQVVPGYDPGPLCLEWIAKIRDDMSAHTEGSFINFPDRDLVDKKDPDYLEKLLRFYYADNLDRLIRTKASWDPNNVFEFEMGIPTK